MAINSTNFRVRNGLHVTGNTYVGGLTTLNDDLTVNSDGVIDFEGAGPHTFKGNTNFGSGTLFVNATNKRVAVNASATSTASDTTDWAFEVTGKTNFSSSIKVGGTSQFNDSVTVGVDGTPKTLTVWGDTTLKTKATIGGNLTVSGNSISIGSGTTPNTVIEGNVWIKGTIKTGAEGNYYDLDDLNTATGSVPVLKVYNVAGTKVFP
jgi:hypothetical protein